MPILIPPLTHQHIADAAAKCLTETHAVGTIPIPIEQIIDVGYRLDLVPTPSLEARFFAIAFITHDLKEIRVDDVVFNKQPYRLRFSLAHELGHLILHQNIYSQMSFKTPADWKKAMDDLGRANYSRLEDQADTFARCLLVPTAHFKNQFAKFASALAQSGKAFKALSEEGQDYAVKGLSRIFDVSPGTIWYRMRDEHLI